LPHRILVAVSQVQPAPDEKKSEYTEEERTWLPPVAKAPNRPPELTPELDKKRSLLLDQIHSYAEGRAEQGSVHRRRSLGLERLNSPSTRTIAFPGAQVPTAQEVPAAAAPAAPAVLPSSLSAEL
jgi:hypothetical protein